MALPTLTAVGPSASSIGSIIGMTWTAGRSAKSDQFSAGRGSITVRNPQTLPAAIVLEALVTLSINSQEICAGYVTNIQYEYGMVANEDIAIISLEGYIARLGRGYLKNFLMGGGSTGFEATRVGNALTGDSATVTDVDTRSNTSSGFITGDAGNIINQLVATEQGRLKEQASSLLFYGRDVTFDASEAPTSYTGFKFTDSNPAGTGIAYDVVTFASLTDNYFTQVTVTPEGLSTVQAGDGARNLQISTYDESDEQAQNLADYTLGEFDTSTSVPVSITTKNSLKWLLDPAKVVAAGVGYRLPVELRGTTYNSVIEGWTVTADPDDVRYSFNVSGYPQNNFFILDDPIYGRLDFNKLSF
jgi:hypothetical protein